MIKKFYSNRNRPGWKYDARIKKYYSWGFDMWLANGHRKRETGFLNRADVESVVARVRQLEREMKYGLVVPVEAPTIHEVCEKKLALTSHPKEKVRAKRVLQDFCVVAQVKRANEVETAHLQRYVDLRRKQGLKPQSVDRELNIIGAALRAGRVHFPALSKWVIPQIPRPKFSKRGRERVVESGELSKVLTVLFAPRAERETAKQLLKRRTVGQVLIFTRLTAARKGEICKLRWDHVLWEAGVIQIVGTKTENRSVQTTRTLPLTPPMIEILRDRQSVSEGPYVFTSGGGEVTHYYEILKAASAKAGVLYGKNTLGGFVTHDMRHTAITQMLQQGHDLATIGSITGQSDKTMVMHYGHASFQSISRAMNALQDAGIIQQSGDGLETASGNDDNYEGTQRGMVPKGGRRRQIA